VTSEFQVPTCRWPLFFIAQWCVNYLSFKLLLKSSYCNKTRATHDSQDDTSIFNNSTFNSSLFEPQGSRVWTLDYKLSKTPKFILYILGSYILLNLCFKVFFFILLFDCVYVMCTCALCNWRSFIVYDCSVCMTFLLCVFWKSSTSCWQPFNIYYSFFV
jgi:hypothetical protein